MSQLQNSLLKLPSCRQPYRLAYVDHFPYTVRRTVGDLLLFN